MIPLVDYVVDECLIRESLYIAYCFKSEVDEGPKYIVFYYQTGASGRAEILYKLHAASKVDNTQGLYINTQVPPTTTSRSFTYRSVDEIHVLEIGTVR
jgi:hypothetical protein